ncbi:L-rhamnose mutarotase [Sphingomonas gellani]|uniref:L-rhamnose mutarotase n=1 Tax=Sphingomonas gellani TaxID=1166340 RepID=A0A1H8AXM3_9SPHN|nr:L-rhamnose mutarotase [Sphingomonas gellani]SEM75500.1 L-rhamnose mutarotase [Sphingomonas gellani]
MPGTTRHVLFLDLKDDAGLIAEYERCHAAGAVPAAVVASIRAAGIADMDIYRSGNRLVMIMETLPDFEPAAKAAADAADPAVQAWERLMDRFQQRLDWADKDEKWVAGRTIFSLTEQD